MGNIMCRNKNRSCEQKSKNQTQQILTKQTTQIGYKPNLEKSSATQNKNKNEIVNKDGWQKKTYVINKIELKENHPVPPPRRKRLSKQQKDKEKIKNGFKNVFVSDTPEPLSETSSLNINLLSKENNVTQIVSKVGNKKSDQFFGENISHCLSDDSYVDNTLEKNLGVVDEELLRSINKEKGNLMYSFEKQFHIYPDDNERFRGEVPVEEDLIIPVKKVRKHVCDDDVTIQKMVHIHDSLPISLAPQKPHRDFGRFRNTLPQKKIIIVKSNEHMLEQNDKIVVEKEKCAVMDAKGFFEMQARVTEEAKLAVEDILKLAQATVEEKKKINKYHSLIPDSQIYKNTDQNIVPSLKIEHLTSLSNETIQFNPMIPQSIKMENTTKSFCSTFDVKTLEKEDLQETSLNKIFEEKIPQQENELNNNQINQTQQTEKPIRPERMSEIIPPNLSNSEKILRRCLSTQSYLTSELIEKIALQANILSMPGGFSPEDTLQINDGSALVSPNYKLDQKRSLSTQISNSNDKIKTEIKKCETNSDIMTTFEPEANCKTNSKPSMKSPATLKNENLITKPTLGEDLNMENIVACEYDQLKIENECETKQEISQSIRNFFNEKYLNPKEILDLMQSEFGDCIFSQYLPPDDELMIKKFLSSVETNQGVTKSSVSKSSTKKEHSKIKSKEKRKISKIPIKNKNFVHIDSIDKRRHSIDDLNAWFSPEKDFPLRKRKREFSLPGCLESTDASKIKFNNTELSAKKGQIEDVNEENIGNYLVNEIVNISHNVSVQEKSDTSNEECKSYNDDHSTLIKFLEHNKF